MAQGPQDRTTSAFSQARDLEDTVKAVAARFDADAGRYEKLLPSHIKLDDFRNAFLTSVQRNPRLLDADRSSFWLALQQAAGDGLKCDGREAALVIFADDEEDEDGNRKAATTTRGKTKQVVYMPMIAGLRKLVRNTGQVSVIESELVFRGEVIKLWREDGVRHMEHVVNTDPEADRSDKSIIGTYAIVVYKDGTWQAEWMSRSDVEKVRAVSRARSQRAPWQSWYSEMTRKSSLRRLIKQLDKSPEIAALAEAMERDPTLGDTIDGEATEIAGSIAAPPADTRPSRRQQEHTTQRTNEPDPDRVDRQVREMQERKHTQQTTQDPAGDAQTGTTAGTAEATSKAAEPTGQRGTATGTQSPPSPTGGGFEAWAVDASGAEVRPSPYTDAVEFAHAIAAMCRDTPPLMEEIWEANEPAIADACDASEEARAILDAVKTRPTLPATDQGTTSGNAPSFRVTPVPPPAKWIGKPLEDYLTAVRQRLDDCHSTEAAAAQFDADKAVYLGKSMQAETRIDRHYQATVARLSGTPLPSRAETITSDLKKGAKSCGNTDQIKAWDANEATQRQVAELKSLDGGEALYADVKVFVANHVADLRKAAQP